VKLARTATSKSIGAVGGAIGRIRRLRP
jgi:hypothetical protein